MMDVIRHNLRDTMPPDARDKGQLARCCSSGWHTVLLTEAGRQLERVSLLSFRARWCAPGTSPLNRTPRLSDWADPPPPSSARQRHVRIQWQGRLRNFKWNTWRPLVLLKPPLYCFNASLRQADGTGWVVHYWRPVALQLPLDAAPRVKPLQKSHVAKQLLPHLSWRWRRCRNDDATSWKWSRWACDGNTHLRDVSIVIPRYWRQVEGWRSNFSQLTTILRSVHNWRRRSR